MTSPTSSQATAPDAAARRNDLQLWLSNLQGYDLLPDTLQSASSDASFRRFYRVQTSTGGSLIAVDAPPATENSAGYIKVAALFKSMNLTVPDVLASNLEQGFLLVTDLGQHTYAQILNPDTAHKLYLDALSSLVLMQTQSQPDVLPEYDRAFLSRELGIFTEWYIGRHLGKTLDEKQQATLNKVFDQILASALAQPQVFVHRDYHSRNLMVMERDNPGVLDFQDAVAGPITYDLVSLLRDCYVSWSQAQVRQWCQAYYQRLFAAGMVEVAFERFQRWFDLMGLQRHLKAIGIFSRLHLRDGKSGYLADIPRTMAYVEAVCANYAELTNFAAFLRQQILPIYQSKL